MNEEEKKAIERIKSELDVNEFMPKLVFECEDIETVLNLIDKQNKVIDYILNDYIAINEIRTIMGLPHSVTTVEELKKVYFRKAEENE